MSPSRWLWACLAFFVLAFGIGTAWDRRWHTTHPFDDFFSPPHLLIYGAFATATFALWRATPGPEAEQTFGERLTDLPLGLPLTVPRGLALLSGAYVVIALAGVCDMIWHTAFGLDETGWSFPHAMLGWGIMLALWGFATAFLSKPGTRHWALRLAAWTVLLAVTCNVVAGPMARQGTVAVVQGIATIPVLAADPAPQHTFRIYEAWNVTRGNPAFLPAAAFGAGLALALALRLEARLSLVLIAATLATFLPVGGDLRTARYFDLARDPRTWFPIPIAFAALTWAALRFFRTPVHAAWGAAGLLFGVVVSAVWKQPGTLALAGAVVMPAGAGLGIWIGARLAVPDRRVFGIVVALGIAVPAALGVLDLWLRSHTP
jgi:hypothetical protein